MKIVILFQQIIPGTGKISRGLMIYVGNGRIHIHVENGEQNEKFMFRKSSGVDTPLLLGMQETKFDPGI